MSQLIHGHELTVDGRHVYHWNKGKVPGVTTILGRIDKPALRKWYASTAAEAYHKAIKDGRTDYPEILKESALAPFERTKEAGDSGTNVHQYAEAVLKNLKLPELKTDASKKGAEAFHKWMDAHKVEMLASERMVFSKEYYYAGTCDLIAKVDGILSVGDFKTGSGIYPEMRFQTAAYQHALQEEKGTLFPQRLIIRFDKKTGEFEAKTFLDFDLDFLGFRSALQLHKTLKAMETK